MLALAILFLLWAACSAPFLMLGFPDAAAAVFGAIAGIGVIVHSCKKGNGESPGPSTYQAPKSRDLSHLVTDDDIDEMIMLDLMDGKLDGKFGFFDKD